MTEKEIKEYVTEIRHKADIFRKSGFATAGFATHFDKSADIIEELLPYMAIGTIEEFKALKEKSVAKKVIDIQINKMQSFCEDDFGRDIPCMINAFQFDCPNCNRKIASRFKVERCPNCKQELNWQ